MQPCVKVATARGRVVEHQQFDSRDMAFACQMWLEEKYSSQYTVEYYDASVLGDRNRNTKRKSVSVGEY